MNCPGMPNWLLASVSYADALGLVRARLQRWKSVSTVDAPGNRLGCANQTLTWLGFGGIWIGTLVKETTNCRLARQTIKVIHSQIGFP